MKKLIKMAEEGDLEGILGLIEDGSCTIQNEKEVILEIKKFLSLKPKFLDEE